MPIHEELPIPRGRVRPYFVSDVTGKRQRLAPWCNNKLLYEWGAIVGRLLAQGDVRYKIGGMYIEFENVADPNDPVVAPSLSRAASEGVAYFDALAFSPDRDYLRVPLISAVLDSSDTVLFPWGNLITFFAQTTGVVGVHGKTFSDSANSKVFGGALVATVDETDATRDLVLSRFYFDTDEQQVKLPSGQLALEWEILLG